MGCITPWITRGCWTRPRIPFSVRSDICSACEIERRAGGPRSHRRCPRYVEHFSALPHSHLSPAPPTELQPHPHAPMLISPQRIPRYALALPPPSPRPLEAHHHQPRQRHAIPTQPHRLPPAGTAEHLPAARITPQADNGMLMGQQDTTRNGPASVGKTGSDNKKSQPPRQRARPHGKPRHCLAGQVGRQQQARALPTALEALTWAGHGPE